MFAFRKFYPNLYGAGTRNLPPRKAVGRFFCIINTIAANVLVILGARVSAGML